jgi:RimJ/RimL family protein N-acetyltransferase
VTISTARLDLIPLPAALVAALVSGDLAAARPLAPFPLDETTFAGDEHVLQLRHAQLVDDPAVEPWLLHAAVHRELGVVVGKIGFHGPPDDAGEVEVGYRVSPEHQRQGLATEMAIGLIAWAASQGARACLASVRPDNTPSLAIIDRLGFERVGEQVDEIDGLEWVFRLPLTALPSYQPPR